MSGAESPDLLSGTEPAAVAHVGNGLLDAGNEERSGAASAEFIDAELCHSDSEHALVL